MLFIPENWENMSLFLPLHATQRKGVVITSDCSEVFIILC